MAKSKPKTRTRRRALNRRMIDKYCEALSNGFVQELAAQATGVSSRSIRKYIANGNALLDRIDDGELNESSVKGYDKLCIELVIRSEEASTKMDDIAMSAIRRAIESGDVKAATWWMEHARAQHYGKFQKVQIEGNPDKKLSLDVILRQEVCEGENPRKALGFKKEE